MTLDDHRRLLNALVDASERWWRRVGQGEQPAYGELLADTGRTLRYPQQNEE